MKVRLKMFALLRDRSGVDEIELVLADGSTVAQAISEVGTRFPSVLAILPRAATAVNLHYSDREHALHDGDELALIPPVSGGA